jgi:hypothetical protein
VVLRGPPVSMVIEKGSPEPETKAMVGVMFLGSDGRGVEMVLSVGVEVGVAGALAVSAGSTVGGAAST